MLSLSDFELYARWVPLFSLPFVHPSNKLKDT